MIKQSSIDNVNLVNKSEIISIKGIANDVIDSLGTLSVNLIFKEITISHIFHIVPDYFNIPSDGILGKDFNKSHKTRIDYEDMTFTIRTPEFNLILPINSEPKQNMVSVPPRCESYRIFHIENFSGSCVIPSQEIFPGIFIPNTIVSDKNPMLKILNTNSESKTFKNSINNSLNLSDFHIFKAEKTENHKQLVNESRVEKLRNLFAKNIPEHVKEKLIHLCSQYADVFALPGDRLTVNNFYSQKLRTKSDAPVYVKNYRLPHTQKEEINRQVENLLKNDLIEPSVSSYNSPLILVPKKSLNGEQKWRMCVDYRMLNKNLIGDKFPLPRIDDILDSLGKAKFFSVLDLFSGFHQIPIEQASREMTAFSTEKGSFRWKVVPFGINVAPNSFSRMMSIAFSGLPSHQSFIYMDDIIVIGCSIEHHLKNLKSVFDVCRKYNLRLNPEKCEFFRHEVTFLGHSCSARGIKPDNRKLDAIDRYPRPTDKESTRRFTAFANYYRRFIDNFAGIAAPLNRLTRKKVEFVWNEECEQAFITLRNCLKNPPILSYPSFEHPFIVKVDASIKHCGGVLSQNYTGHDLPISFISKSFQKGELNKPIIEKELLAIHFAITSFRPYLYGQKFTVKSDHRPLVYLYNLKNPASKLTRIRLELEEYDFVVEHIKGKDNVVADALSRVSINELKEKAADILLITRSMSRKQAETVEKEKEKQNLLISPKIIYEQCRQFNKKVPRVRCTMISDNSQIKISAHINHKNLVEFSLTGDFSKIELIVEIIFKSLEREMKIKRKNKIQWPCDDNIFKFISMQKFKEIGEKTLNELNISIIPKVHIIKDKDEKLKILQSCHDDPLFGGHSGQAKLYSKVRSQFYWKNMRKDVVKFVNSCEKCKLNKRKNKVKMPMFITPTPQNPFDIVIADPIGRLPTSNNRNEYALTVMCDLTKFLIAVPLKDKSAATVARAIFENIILTFGLFGELRSDCGTEFKGVLSELCKLLRIDQKISAPYRHETVGTIERSHRTFNEYIRAYVSNVEDWEEYLKYFTFSYNISPHTSLGNKYTPYELVFNKKPILPFNLDKLVVEPIYNIDNFALESKYKLQKAHKEAQRLLHAAKLRNKTIYDKNMLEIEVKVNDNIYVENLPYDKHKPIYSGPFVVSSLNPPNVTFIDTKTNRERTVHMNRIRK